MQLKKKINLRASLAAATCSLLGASPIARVQAEDGTPWIIDTGALYYGEQDGRVQDLSINALVNKEFKDGQFLNLRFAVDSLTGATPIGARSASTPQSFTTPSGDSSFVTPPGEIPLDDSFLDTRIALGADWEQPIGDVSRIALGASFSTEYDYEHMGVNVTFSRDFFQRNTTLTGGVALASDDIEPVGGAPIPFAPMRGIGDSSSKLGTDSKDIVDLLIGVTQVINRRTLLQFNYTYSDESGYLNNPYNVVSVIDGNTGDPVLGPDAPGPPLYKYLYESRPDSRTKHSVFAKMKYRFDRSTLAASYRYMTDDWEIDSHTFDIRYRWEMNRYNYIEPHVRLYTQSAADFYSTSLIDGGPLPKYVSADYRLGEFDGTTVGAKYGHVMRNGNEWSTRLEYYSTTGTGVSAIEYPDLQAIIFQVSYRLNLGD